MRIKCYDSLFCAVRYNLPVNYYDMHHSRRSFLKKSTQLAAATTLTAGFPAILQASIPPSEQVNMAVIGCRNRGFRVLRQHLDLGGVNCVAMCDIDESVLNEKAASIEKNYGQKPKLYKDFRKLLEQKDINAVIIGTPDHWHCIQTVSALEAGLDVYVEKPLANTIAECEIIVKAAKRYNRIVQVGQQQRSGPVWHEVMDYMKSGKLGFIHKTDIWANFNYGLGPRKRPDAPVPIGVDYDMFLGPAPERPFNPSRFHGEWRHFWDYGGGLMTDFGAHLIDMALWVKDITTPPQTILAHGSQFDRPELAKETFDTMTVVYPFGNYTIQWESNAGKQTGPYGMNYGLAFLGEKGTLVVNRGGWEVIPEWDNAAKTHKVAGYKSGKFNGGHDDHMRNFIDCIKKREQTAATADIGANVALYAHAANIAVRSGSYKLEWNAEKGNFGKAKAANALIEPEYRKPWALPKI